MLLQPMVSLPLLYSKISGVHPRVVMYAMMNSKAIFFFLVRHLTLNFNFKRAVEVASAFQYCLFNHSIDFRLMSFHPFVSQDRIAVDF